MFSYSVFTSLYLKAPKRSKVEFTTDGRREKVAQPPDSLGLNSPHLSVPMRPLTHSLNAPPRMQKPPLSISIYS